MTGREEARERHPSSRPQRQVIRGVPGLPVDGEPLSAGELKAIERIGCYLRAGWDEITAEAGAFSDGHDTSLCARGAGR